MREELAGLGRYAEPGLLVLISLAGGPKHGYAIMDDCVTLDGARIGPGTLYAALARLERRGLVEPLPAADRRRPYRLTEAGAAALRAHREGMERVAVTGLRRLATGAAPA
jgi:DNA-binding PadR family transcriptional regulator